MRNRQASALFRQTSAFLLSLLTIIAVSCKPKPQYVNVPPPPTNRPKGTFGQGRPTTTGQPVAGNPNAPSDKNLTLGNPTEATPNPSQRENYLIEYPQYSLSYNATAGRPNWVSWHLIHSHIGNLDRGKFHPDADLPSGFYKVTPRDYTNTGYDRGHYCPSKDRSADREDNDATFRMSNIMPQAGGNNQGPWKDLEDYTRDQIEKGNEAYIVCGGSGQQGSIAGGKVSVPANTWKVIVILPDQSGNDLARVNAQTRVIAVLMPNQENVRGKDWRTFRVSPRQIEQETGYHFLANVSASVRDTLEGRVDNQP